MRNKFYIQTLLSFDNKIIRNVALWYHLNQL